MLKFGQTNVSLKQNHLYFADYSYTVKQKRNHSVSKLHAMHCYSDTREWEINEFLKFQKSLLSVYLISKQREGFN